MTAEEFKKRHNLRPCDRCCATCKHGSDLMSDGAYACTHEDIEYPGLVVSESDVCDAWERR